MSSDQPLSKDEFKEMMQYLRRHVDAGMDQWELWSFDSKRGKAFVTISLKSDGADESYDDLNSLLE